MMLDGQVALVTGAGKGIGRAIAIELAREGAKVVINALHKSSAENTCKELLSEGHESVAFAADVGNNNMVEDMVAQVLKRFWRIDIMVNNAALPADIILFKDTTKSDRDNEMVTLEGAFNCTRAVLDTMITQRSGRIINISSVGGRTGEIGRAVYSAAKAGMDIFTRALAKELGQYNITVNSVSPGAIESPRFKARSEAIREAHRKLIALCRFGEPEEVAHLVVFLASKKASYITGAVIPIDGGITDLLEYPEEDEVS